MEKQCFKCHEVKPIDDFYRHGAMADGHLGKCKACTKSDTKRYYRATLPERKAYERRRGTSAERRSAKLAYQLRLRLKDPQRARARYAVASAIRGGRITRQPCKECGATKVQAHHHDYSRPLDVEWLCFRCHRNERHGQYVVPETAEISEEPMSPRSEETG